MSKSKKKNYENGCYIDILRGNKIYLRFDLYGELPRYTRARVKQGLFEVCVENAMTLMAEGEKYKIKVIAQTYDLIIRYLEYIEWYERRPDKIKHLDYIVSQLQSGEDRAAFLNELHYYTGFPEVRYEIEKGKKGLIENIKFIFEKCKGKSLTDLWCIFKQKVL